MIVAVRTHNNKPKKANLRNEQYAYNFSIEAGLSRSNGTKLLQVIRKFKPILPVPHSIQTIGNRIKKNVHKFQDCIKLTIPWIENWRMHELKGFLPVKIYVRNLFEVISHMLVDPEILFAWKDLINLRYHKATDRDNQHVYTDVMSSNWALGTEKLIFRKDPLGYLLPLIFYTDGVQVSASVHNKITPVIVTLGIFGD